MICSSNSECNTTAAAPDSSIRLIFSTCSASGEAEATQRRHATFYLALIEGGEQELHGPRQAGWFARLELEHHAHRALAAQAADRNPNSARNLYLGAKALCQLEKTDLCLNWLQRSSALDPSYPEPLYLLSRVYRKLGQDGKAKEVEARFLELKEKQPDRRR